MKIEIPHYSNLTVEEIHYKNCGMKIDREDSSVEINVSVWINGYINTISASNYFCNDCSSNGFEIKALKDNDKL